MSNLNNKENKMTAADIVQQWIAMDSANDGITNEQYLDLVKMLPINKKS